MKKDVSTSILKFPKIFILLFLVSFANFLGLLLTPALPAIDRDFPSYTSAWIMSMFLVGYALGQLPFGPLANRFGRKKAITIGMAIALLGTIWAYFATGFWVLCFARFIQALGSGVGLNVGFTIINDLRAKREVSATLSAAFGFIPGIATTLGGFLTEYFNWKSCFLFLSVYIISLWLFTRILPETAPELHKDAIQLKKIAHNYIRHFKDPFLMLHAFLAGLSTIMIYLFATFAPFIGINEIGLSSDEYGVLVFVPSMGILCGALVSNFIGNKMKLQSNILFGVCVAIASIIVLSFCFAYGMINSWSLFLTAFFLYFGCNLIWSNAIAQGMSEAYDKSNASAVVQFINVGTGTLGLFIAQAIPIQTIILYPSVLGIISIFALAIWVKLKSTN